MAVTNMLPEVYFVCPSPSHNDGTQNTQTFTSVTTENLLHNGKIQVEM